MVALKEKKTLNKEALMEIVIPINTIQQPTSTSPSPSGGLIKIFTK